jgi:hypothetical protein
MNASFRLMVRSGMLALSVLLSGCATSDQSASQTGAPWVRDLNEPPPSREPLSGSAAQQRSELNKLREKTEH